jgi:hypothetical protein
MAALLSQGPPKIRSAGASVKPTNHLVARSAEAAIHSWAGRRPHWRQRIRRAVSGLVPMFIGLCTESAWMFVEELEPTIWSNLSLKWLCVRVGLPCLSFAFPSRSAVFHPVPAQCLWRTWSDRLPLARLSSGFRAMSAQSGRSLRALRRWPALAPTSGGRATSRLSPAPGAAVLIVVDCWPLPPSPVRRGRAPRCGSCVRIGRRAGPRSFPFPTV